MHRTRRSLKLAVLGLAQGSHGGNESGGITGADGFHEAIREELRVVRHAVLPTNTYPPRR